jgi:hypothetical protein
MNSTSLVYDIKFYQVDDDGNEILNKKNETKIFRLKEGIRFKPLEYLCEDIDNDILEEIKENDS